MIETSHLTLVRDLQHETQSQCHGNNPDLLLAVQVVFRSFSGKVHLNKVMIGRCSVNLIACAPCLTSISTFKGLLSVVHSGLAGRCLFRELISGATLSHSTNNAVYRPEHEPSIVGPKALDPK